MILLASGFGAIFVIFYAILGSDHLIFFGGWGAGEFVGGLKIPGPIFDG